jgi:hypothetical protein
MPGGRVLDRVRPRTEVLELAAPVEAPTVQALDAAGAVLGSCPPDGVAVGGVIYPCTIAPWAEPPVTTIPEP